MKKYMFLDLIQCSEVDTTSITVVESTTIIDAIDDTKTRIIDGMGSSVDGEMAAIGGFIGFYHLFSFDAGFMGVKEFNDEQYAIINTEECTVELFDELPKKRYDTLLAEYVELKKRTPKNFNDFYIETSAIKFTKIIQD